MITRYTLLVVFSLFSILCLAQEEDDVEKLARELANPTATLGTMNFFPDIQQFKGSLPDADQSGFTVSFQPALPKPLSNGMNLFVRPLIPFIFSTPLPSEDGGFESSGFSLGNISFDVAIGKTTPSGLFYFIGMAGTAPTASEERLRTQWALGPEIALGYFGKKFVGGGLLSQSWGLEENEFGETSSTFGGQYFYAIPIGKGRVIGAGPTFAYDWNAEQFTLPVGTGYSVTKKFGKTPIKLGFQYWYYVEQAEPFGPDWTIRIQISPVVPLPW